MDLTRPWLNRLLRRSLLVLFIGSASAICAEGQQMSFGGCFDALGRPVPNVPNAQLNDIAMATVLPNGAPVIVYNPSVVARESPVVDRFFYIHECAHHALGQVMMLAAGRRGPISRDDEQAADCEAIAYLVRSGEFGAAAVQHVQARLSGNAGDFTHLPGPVRATNLAECLNVAQVPVPPGYAATTERPTAERLRRRTSQTQSDDAVDAKTDQDAATPHGRAHKVGPDNRDLDGAVDEVMGNGDGAALEGTSDADLVLAAVRSLGPNIEEAGGDRFSLRRPGGRAVVYFESRDGALGADPKRNYMGYLYAHPGQRVLSFRLPTSAAAWRRTSSPKSVETRWSISLPMTVSVYEVSPPEDREACTVDVDVRGVLTISVSGGKATFANVSTNPVPERARYSYQEHDCVSVPATNPHELDILWELK